MINQNKINRFLHSLDVLWVLIGKEMKAKYKVAGLGYLWSLVQPLSSAIIFYFVFKMVVHISIEDYPLFLIIGLYAWQWFAVAVHNSLASLIHNASVIKKINFPRELIPISIVLVEMIHFIVTIPILVAAMFFFGVKPHLNAVFLSPLLLIVQFSFTLALCLFVSAVNLFFRDMERLVTVFMMLLFYLTPVVYAFEMVPVDLQDYISLNPMAIIVNGWRDVLYNGHLDWSALGLVSMLTGGLSSLSYWIFIKLSPRFAEIL